MNAAPVVSVVLPTRNRAALLQRALRSVLAQTFPDFEVVVVDDASSDETPTVLAEQTDPRVRAVRLEERGGGARARNCGISAARASCIAFIDDDDEWLPAKLERQLEAAHRDGNSVVYCPALFIDEIGREKVLQCGPVPPEGARRALLKRNFISTPTVLVTRTSLVQAGGFDERLPRLQDWDLWIRLAANAQFTFVPEPLVRAHHTSGGISTSSEALIDACRLVETKYDLPADELSDLYHALGHILMIGGAPAHAGRYLWRSVRLRPTPVRAAMAVLSRAAPAAYGAIARLHEGWTRRFPRSVPERP